MSSLYLHIPYCRQACHYCDFHFRTNLSQKNRMVEAICKEIRLRKDYLPSQSLQSVYFGGGTPSLLSRPELERIIQEIKKYYAFQPDIECTLEANPDDLQPEKLSELRALGINRLSIGIQRFSDERLHFLNRSHNASQAKKVVKEAREAGFDNLSIDLMYGIPPQNIEDWKRDLENALHLEVDHISAYCLTIEENTVFGNWAKKGRLDSVSDSQVSEEFDLLVQTLESNAYEQYEISNFARRQAYARHNSHYWLQGAYLGLGPSAHSYNGHSREYNVAHNEQYMQALDAEHLAHEIEILQEKDHINEYIMTRLRTMWGCDTQYLLQKHNFDLKHSASQELTVLAEQGFIFWEGSVLKLSKPGKLLADEISARLFL